MRNASTCVLTSPLEVCATAACPSHSKLDRISLTRAACVCRAAVRWRSRRLKDRPGPDIPETPIAASLELLSLGCLTLLPVARIAAPCWHWLAASTCAGLGCPSWHRLGRGRRRGGRGTGRGYADRS